VLKISSNRGFTLVELLVSLSIFGVLVALLLPAIQQTRATARRMACLSNLRQIGVAVHSYLDVHHQFPGHSSVSRGCLYSLLPFIEQETVFRQNEEMFRSTGQGGLIPIIPVYLCPEDPLTRSSNVTSYVINKGYGPAHGFLFGRVVSPADVTDGLSYTAFLSEMVRNNRSASYTLFADFDHIASRSELEVLGDHCLQQANYAAGPAGGGSGPVNSGTAGYNHLLPPNAPTCLFSPYPVDIHPAVGVHAQGVNVLLADGSARFISENIDRGVWWNLGTINSGDIVSQ